MRVVLVLVLVAAGSACGRKARLPVEAGTGLAPTLPAPERSTIPVVKVARAVGWPAGATPTPAEGLVVRAFATGLSHPRNLYVLPNGDVLVAETNAPAGRDEGHGIRAWFMKRFFKKAGAAVPSPDRITLLRDADGDGVAETRTTFLAKLHSPYGMALIGDQLYVGNTGAVVRFRYRDGQTSITELPVEVKLLPDGRVNHHWTKNLLASADGKRLFVAVGSNSNVGERGMALEVGRAAVHEIDLATGTDRVFASGLRNPVGMAWEPETGALWVAVNERDELGSDLVPDYITHVREGAFYGWPYSYYGPHLDSRPKPPRPDLVAKAVVPDYALGPHTASLGLAAAPASLLPSRFARGMFVGQHGSWNRKPLSGYRVIFVPFAGGKPTGAQPLPVLDGFLDADEHARGRPVGVAVDKRGALLVADDVGNAVWRVTGAK